MDIEHSNSDDLQDEEFQFVGQNVQSSQQQNFFDHVVALLQQIVISAQFGNQIQEFMGNNWHSIEDANAAKQHQVFTKFNAIFTQFLTQKLSAQIPDFNMAQFFTLLKLRRNQVDEQLLDTLDSMADINCFNQFIRDCKISHDEVETYKVLTIKSNKIPENKTVKGKDNIFGASNSNPLFQTKMKKNPKPVKQEKLLGKTEDELMVPDLVLTVKGIRKQ